MPIIVKGTTTYAKAPEGVHHAVCVDALTEFNVTKKNKQGEEYTRDELTLIFQLNTPNPDNDNKRFQVRRIFGLNLASTGHLKSFLESWRGKKFTQEELDKGFDVAKLVGVNANVQILHNGDWANIQGIMPLSPGQQLIQNDGYSRKTAETPQPVQQTQTATATNFAPEQFNPSSVPAPADDDVPF